MATTTKPTDDVTIEDLTAERNRLTTEVARHWPGSVDFFTLTAELAQVDAELARREIPELEQQHAAAEARVAEKRRQVAELLATYEAAKRAAEAGPGATYHEAKYDLDLEIERARNADGHRGELAKARYRLAAATRSYHKALADREAAEERQRRQAMTRLVARAEHDRINARPQPPQLPEVPAPDLVPSGGSH